MLHDRGKPLRSLTCGRASLELPSYPKAERLTLVHLLRHTSGLPDYMRLKAPSMGSKGYLTNADFVGEFGDSEHPLAFPTGERHECV